MSAKRLAAALAILFLVGWALHAASQETSVGRDAVEHMADLEVTLEHVGGKIDNFTEEIVRLELILNTAGRLDQVHLITRTGSDADTHIWYNVDNLVSVRYRFLEITGKGKVAVRAPVRLPRDESSAAPRKPVAPLDPDDYR